MLEHVSYCPILHTRIAEIKALKNLPLATKDKIFPLFVARPWPNAKDIRSVWQKITEAFGARRFYLDLDRNMRLAIEHKPASVQFSQFFDSGNGYSNYYELVESIPFAVPVLRTEGISVSFLEIQKRHVESLDRGVAVRLEYSSGFEGLSIIDSVVNSFNDLCIFVDTGWHRNLLSREQWASDAIKRITNINSEVEIVVTGSSFPDSFADMDAKTICDLRERRLFSNLVRQHNSAHLVYGDWGSTRPSIDPTPMKLVPRIDLPTKNDWILFRRDKNLYQDEEYSEIATRMIADPTWPRDLSIWGKYIIECTAEDLPGGIRNPASAAAVRINIHLHEQAYFNDERVANDGDEPYTDD